ncbi:hypothetical protein K438DRAFT_1987252 [Mycena galopus ATCC 62051]|nr:hypothetical protein K438DRAFT_1987252 [Mycena galopus ATCC 62051]
MLRRAWVLWDGPESQAGVEFIGFFSKADSLVKIDVDSEYRFVPTLFPMHHRLIRYDLDDPWSTHLELLKSLPNLREVRITRHFDANEPWPQLAQTITTILAPYILIDVSTRVLRQLRRHFRRVRCRTRGLDYALQMAHSNFSGAMFHTGGQSVFYNPFTALPTNQPRHWFTPTYGIYENGNPVRVALFNYITDPSGTSDVTAVISVDGGTTTPQQVHVKYLRAASVSQKGNYTYMGRAAKMEALMALWQQIFGGIFESDGRLQGIEDVHTVHAAAQTEDQGTPSKTLATTVVITKKSRNTATIAASVLATSNGHGVQRIPSTPSRGLLALVLNIVPGV